MSEDKSLEKTGIARLFLLALGLLSTGLGVLGAFLPVLPTTPFLLLAAYCFARSSPALHRRLLENKVVGPHILQWSRERSVRRDVKLRAFVLVVITFAISIAFVDAAWMRVTLGVVGVALIWFLSRVPTTPRSTMPVGQRPA